MNGEIWRRPATLVALLVVGLAIVALLFFAFAGGSPTASPLPSASPTAAAQVSPSAGTSLLPGATIGPGTSPSPQPTGSPEPSTSPEPPPSAPITPAPITPAPITPGSTATAPSSSPSAAPPAGWIELDDFPTYGRATEVSSITAGGPGFVAVGSSSGRPTPQGRVWTSQDGRRWTAQPDDLFAGHQLDIVVRAGQTLYAFGDSRIWSSPDGATWSELPPPQLGGGILDVTVSGSTLIAVGEVVDDEENFSAAVWRSADGTAWQRVSAPPMDTWLYTVAANGNMLVASQGYPQFSPPLLWYSTDLGDTWQPAQTDVDGEGNLGVVDIAADGGRFVAVGYEERADYEPLLLVSTDGASWQSASLPPAAAGQIFDQVSARPGGYLALAHRSGGDGQSWTSASGADWSPGPTIYERNLVFQPGDTPGDDVVTHRALAVGNLGAVVAESWRFAEPGEGGLHVWFAPLAVFQ